MTKRIDEGTRRNDSGRKRERKWSEEIETTTAKTEDREKGHKKEKERHRKQKTGRIDEGTWRNDSGIQRQRKWTDETETTTAKTEDRENGLKKEEERQHRKQKTGRIDEGTGGT